MTGIYITLISGLIGLFGWEMLLLAAGTDPKRFGQMANRYTSWMQQYFDALAETDVPVVMVHDDIVWSSGPFIRPAWYREYVFPNYINYFAPLLESGKKIMYTSDGNFNVFIDDIAKSGVHGFVFEPMTSLADIVEKYGQTHIIIGNADTRILLNGTRDQIRTKLKGAWNWAGTVLASLWPWATIFRRTHRSRSRSITTRCMRNYAGVANFCTSRRTPGWKLN